MKAGHPAARWAGIAAAALLLSAAGQGAVGGSAPADDYRYDGEYGLWVRVGDDSLTVSWLGREAGPGRLEVLVDGRTAHRATTPAGIAHTVSLERPKGRTALLRYGAVEDSTDRHETRIRLRERARPPDGTLDAVDSLFVVGDVHGEFDRLTRLLRNAGLVDAHGRWAGGRRHLVLLGDLVDRGADVTRLLWFVYGLEAEAEEAGGGVHVVLGNHELMVMSDDLRYVHGKERIVAQRHGTTYPRLFDPETSVLGRWLASRPGLLRIGRLLLAHGGVGPAYAKWSVEAANDSLHAFVHEPLFAYLSDSTVAVPPMDSTALHRRLDFLFDAGSLFWYRGYVASDTLGDLLGRVLERHRSDRHIVGHTPVGRVEARYGGRLLAVDLEAAGSELLLLVRDPRAAGTGAYRPYRVLLEGPPEPLASD